MKDLMSMLSQHWLVILVAAICVFAGGYFSRGENKSGEVSYPLAIMIFMVMEWPRTLALILVSTGLIAGYFLFGGQA